MSNTSKAKKTRKPTRVYTPLEQDAMRNARVVQDMLGQLHDWVAVHAIDEGVEIATLRRDLEELASKRRERQALIARFQS